MGGDKPADAEHPPVRVRYLAGTVEIRGLVREAEVLPADCRWDPRSRCHRAPARAYADILRALAAGGRTFEDEARGYEVLTCRLRLSRQARPFQTEALDAWLGNRGRGTVILPTGSGKSWLALMAIDRKRRSTLVVAPTLDLVRQWYDQLRTAYDTEVGVIGGGEHRLEPLTVTTYDSAWMNMEHLGNRFGMVVFDECHHLPGASYAQAAELCLAPFRLGLTATPERADGREEALQVLVGPEVYRRDIEELSGDWLSEYDTERISVELSPAEREAYQEARAVYIDFLRAQRLRVASPRGWQEFIRRCAQSADGRRALEAYHRQRGLAFAAEAKLDLVEHLLWRHRRDRAILFTQNNATAYRIARRFLIPAITHQTKVRERSALLEGLAKGTYRALVTSKVLNEGVDVPDANVAIVISGSGSVREHVQRLGRILRKRDGKRAILYELVSTDTSEGGTSDRRREHGAYQ